MDRCTGDPYPVNPDAPSEGIDVYHFGPCPVHPEPDRPRCAHCGRYLRLPQGTTLVHEWSLAPSCGLGRTTAAEVAQ